MKRTDCHFPDFSIIIVTWNTYYLTRKCIQSIYKMNPNNHFEIIVVDNGSVDNTVHFLKNEFPDVRFILNNKNKGYAYANNQAIKISRGRILIFLNSDTELITLSTFRKIDHIFNKYKNYGILGGSLTSPKGRMIARKRKFLTLWQVVKQYLLFSNSMGYKNYKSDVENKDKPVPSDYVDGAFLCIRKKLINDIGAFREDFFMYAEDMDICWRAWQKKWQVGIVFNIKILHHHGASSKKNFQNALVNSVQNNTVFIYEKQGEHHARIAFFLQCAGLLIRIPLSFVTKSHRCRDYYNALCILLKSKIA